MSIAAELRIRTHAKRLRLPLVAGQAVRFAEEAAAARHDHLEFLAALLDAEVAQRDVNVERARIIQARFPELKELSDFNFALVPSLNAPLVSDLARCSFIDRREVVLAVGPPGTGKTHTAIGLGLAACRKGKRVRFVTVAELVTELAEAQAEHRLSRLEEQLDRIDLLVCDELGFLRLDADQAQLLFILLAHRYTRGGLVLTSNLEFADWTSVFNDDATPGSPPRSSTGSPTAATCCSSAATRTGSARAWRRGSRWCTRAARRWCGRRRGRPRRWDRRTRRRLRRCVPDRRWRGGCTRSGGRPVQGRVRATTRYRRGRAAMTSPPARSSAPGRERRGDTPVRS